MKSATKINVDALIKPSSSQKVRNKFLNMIGIQSPSNLRESSGLLDTTRKSIAMRNTHPRQNVVNFVVDLKYNHIDDICHNRKVVLPNHIPRGERRITFDNNVAVVPIPKRDEYSGRVATRIWSSAIEINENAARNSVEFAAEGWNWRTVTEDDNMYICSVTGELIHPVHFGNNYY